ncbi:hypothetical protein ACVWWO_003219 [Bradyrhizobium sp. F1.13.1]
MHSLLSEGGPDALCPNGFSLTARNQQSGETVRPMSTVRLELTEFV